MYCQGALVACFAALAVLRAYWKFDPFFQSGIHEGSRIISNYIKIPFNDPYRHTSTPMVQGTSHFGGQGNYGLGWFVLPTKIEGPKDALQTGNANVEGWPEGNAYSAAKSVDPLINDLRRCKSVFDDLLRNENEVLPPRNLREGLLLCHQPIRKCIERESGNSTDLPPKRQRRASDTDAYPKSPFDSRKDAIRKTLNRGADSHRRVCEETICMATDLEKTCASSSKHLKKETKVVCRMCYPSRNYSLIRAHCMRRRRQEARAFYVLCALLIAAIAAAVLLVLLRDIRKQSREESRLVPDRRAKKSPNRPSTMSRPLKLIGPNTRFPWLSRALFLRRKKDNAEQVSGISWDDVESSTAKDSTLQRKWSRFGLFAKGPRKRVQDLFDLESLKSRKGSQSTVTDTMERVPVLPRARRTSVRLPLTEIDAGPPLRDFYGDDVRPLNDHFATIHTTRPSDRGSAIPETRTVQ